MRDWHGIFTPFLPSCLPAQGEVEAELTTMNFDQLSIMRPGFLLCDRQDRRLGEKCVVGVLKPMSKVFPTALTTPTPTVAKAMANLAAMGPAANEDKSKIFEIKSIFKMAGEM